MLNRFNSNTRQLNRIVKKYNLTNISASVYEGIEVSGSNNFKTIIGDYIFQSASLNDKYHDGKGTTLNPTGSETGSVGQGGYSNLPNELSASIEYTYTASLDVRIPTKFGGRTRSNPNPIKLVNNKTKISDFYQEILKNSAKQIEKGINDFSNVGFGSLIIYSSSLDYGTEGASPNNFEVLVYGLQIPGNYSIKEIGDNVVITLNSNYIDFDNVTINNIRVRGKFKQ
jgi:hypothetical protein